MSAQKLAQNETIQEGMYETYHALLRELFQSPAWGAKRDNLDEEGRCERSAQAEAENALR